MIQFASTFQTEYSVLKDPLRFLWRLRTHICHILLKSLVNFIKRLGQGDLKRRWGRLFLNHCIHQYFRKVFPINWTVVEAGEIRPRLGFLIKADSKVVSQFFSSFKFRTAQKLGEAAGEGFRLQNVKSSTSGDTPQYGGSQRR